MQGHQGQHSVVLILDVCNDIEHGDALIQELHAKTVSFMGSKQIESL